MQFLTSLIGGSGNTILNAALALGIVIVLIFIGLWVLKLISNAASGASRGKARRLMVVDTLPVDGKRSLMIVRRDNVEHLILTGGPSDVVVEAGIPVDTIGTRVAARRAASGAPAGQPVVVAAPQPAQRVPVPPRPSAAEPPPPPPVASNDEIARSPVERLRDLGRPAGQRRPASLRHTGLLRPTSRPEPGFSPAAGDNSVRNPDSATSGRVTPFGAPRDNGQAFSDDEDIPRGQRDEGY